MAHRSPITGRFISNAGYARWYAPGRELRREYTKATRRWSRAAAKRKEKEKLRPPKPPREEVPLEEYEDYVELEEDLELEASDSYEEES